MEYDPKDNDVIHLLKKLKDANGSYPQEMLALRRQGYLRQVAEISGVAGLAMGLKNIAKNGGGKAASMSSATGTVVEALLIFALMAEAGAVTYFYRDRIAQYFRSVTNTNAPHVQEVSNPPVLSSPILEIELTPSPILTGTDTLTPVVTPSLGVTPSMDVTPSLELAADPTDPNVTSNTVNRQSAPTQVQAASTQVPNVNNNADDKGNNGNQYGLTPKPVRTKENGNNPPPKDQENSSESQEQSTGSKDQEKSTDSKKKP